MGGDTDVYVAYYHYVPSFGYLRSSVYAYIASHKVSKRNETKTDVLYYCILPLICIRYRRKQKKRKKEH